MTYAQQFALLCREKPGVTWDNPFGPDSVCYRVGGKIFAHILPEGAPGALSILLEDESIPREKVLPMAILRCDPEEGESCRMFFPRSVFRPYHSPRAQWSYAYTVLLDGRLPEEVLAAMAEHAYQSVFARLTKKTQREIMEKSGHLTGIKSDK